MQIKAAQSLIQNYEKTELFTDEQIAHLQKIASQPREHGPISKAQLQNAIERLDKLIEEDMKTND